MQVGSPKKKERKIAKGHYLNCLPKSGHGQKGHVYYWMGDFMEKRKKYSKELKLQAVKTFLKGEKSCSVIAKDLDVSSRKRIIEWVSIYRKKGAAGFNIKPRKPASRNKGRVKKNFADEKEELEYLRAKVDLLEKIISFNVKKK